MSNHLEVFEKHLMNEQRIHVQQVLEGFEILLGWETRNKYRILDSNLRPLAYAAEKSTGISGTLMRGFFGHWRKFQIEIFNENREKMYVAHFPFRWFFKTLILNDINGKHLGHLQQRFAVLRKKFDVYDSQDRIIARINSSFFRFWTFEFRFRNRKLGTIQKKWSGLLNEFFTDKDNFVVSFADPDLKSETKALMLATCLMVDVVYFENNNRKGGAINLFD